MKDKFEDMYRQQAEFLRLLRDKRSHPDFPLDFSKKEDQQFVKHLAHECMNELFEMTAHLKNTKRHRATELTDFDKGEYTEEMVDVLHYLLGIAIYSGISSDELYEAFMKKGDVNVARIEGAY